MLKPKYHNFIVNGYSDRRYNNCILFLPSDTHTHIDIYTYLI